MKKKYKNIFFSIAGFIVKIVLFESKNKLLSQEYGEKISRMFQYFLIRGPKESDLSIIFEDKKYIVQVNQFTINKGLFIQIAKKKNSNTYTTSYSLSTSQLFFLMNKIVFDHIAKRNCFTFHTSGIYVKNTAYLFSGKSTAGKSTIVKLIKDDQLHLLCDDYGFVRKIDRTFYFYPPGPFERLHHPSPNRKYKIGGIYLIQKSQRFKINKMDYVKNKRDLFDAFQKQITIPHAKKKDPLHEFLSANEHKIFSLEFEKKKMTQEQKKALMKSS